jgi:ketosteroid isomerase-like protein
MNADFARRFALEWIAAWNAHDLERIFSHYADDFEMRSPLIVERMGIASGRLKGKEHVRPYWAKGLSATPPLHFELETVLAGVDSITILYRRASRKLAAETLFFCEDGKVIRGVAHHDVGPS